MLNELLYTIAIDGNGNSIHIDKAEKGINYYCPECKNEFILRKSGKTGKGSRRPHFAHNQKTTNCTPEGYLHSSFKLMLLEKMKDCLKQGLPIDIKWKCNYCNKEHGTDLLKGVVSVKEEYDMKTCRPDIALFYEKGIVLLVIEIIVTHAPEDNVIRFYKENKITLIQIKLDSLEDLENIEKRIKNPSSVDFCFNKANENYGPNNKNMIDEYVKKSYEYFKRKELIRRNRNRL